MSEFRSSVLRLYLRKNFEKGVESSSRGITDREDLFHTSLTIKNLVIELNNFVIQIIHN